MLTTPEPACRPHVEQGNDLWHPPGHEAPEQRAKRVREAKAVCATCPLLAACEKAVTADDWGIWAGRTQDERGTNAVCREKQGTISGVSRHRRAQDPLCDPCREAKRAGNKRHWREKRAAA